MTTRIELGERSSELMADAYRQPPGGGYTPVGKFLSHLAVIEWASRDTDVGVVGVYPGTRDAWVAVAGPGGVQRYGPFSFDVSRATLAAELARRAGLAESPPEADELPDIVEWDEEAPWRDSWVGLLWYLGTFAWALRDVSDSLRYESIEVDPGKLVSITVVDEIGNRWISRIRLHPFKKSIESTAFDISSWIGTGLGEAVDERTRVMELRDW